MSNVIMEHFDKDEYQKWNKEMFESEFEPCPECKGTGEREITTHVGEEGMHIEMDVPITCSECNGTGKVKIETDE